MKYFVTSDLHGFFKEFKDALDKAGYDYLNKNHILVICGDIFDRGKEALEVYTFLKKIPKDNLIMIRGNHDYLFMDLVDKDKPSSNDIEDGTFDTLVQLSKIRDDFHQIKNSNIIKEVYEWMKNEWKAYYEVGNYIFTHSFIPLRIKDSCKDLNDIDIYNDLYYDPSWRNITDPFLLRKCAFDSSWRKYDAGYFNEEAKKGKVIVCGHTHSYEFFKGLDHKVYLDNNKDYGIYKKSHVINLDGNVEKSGIINVLVIDED